MKEVVTKNTIEPMTVEIPPIKKSLGQTLGVATGFTIAGIGVLMMISLVLFIPGIFGVLIGLVIAVASTPKTGIDCPLCGTETPVPLKSKKLKCERSEERRVGKEGGRRGGQ